MVLSSNIVELGNPIVSGICSYHDMPTVHPIGAIVSDKAGIIA